MYYSRQVLFDETQPGLPQAPESSSSTTMSHIHTTTPTTPPPSDFRGSTPFQHLQVTPLVFLLLLLNFSLDHVCPNFSSVPPHLIHTRISSPTTTLCTQILPLYPVIPQHKPLLEHTP
ncbi:hypothetical protein Patl1_27559 [Pistacia atlantica]|uniref:Uncharacterized protein n=1 Tax=Pistacia atlantica TaxID=434234 RepID=A0ACC1BGB4_9ROSI|nr:hypothetical protein Patl1_27559 [Pistacia atlantica]